MHQDVRVSSSKLKKEIAERSKKFEFLNEASEIGIQKGRLTETVNSYSKNTL